MTERDMLFMKVLNLYLQTIPGYNEKTRLLGTFEREEKLCGLRTHDDMSYYLRWLQINPKKPVEDLVDELRTRRKKTYGDAYEFYKSGYVV